MSDHHHHYHGSSHSSSWHYPLFDVADMGSYCYNFFCPCSAFYTIYMKILEFEDDVLPSGSTTLCSMITCSIPSCLTANEIVRFCLKKTAASKSVEHEKEDNLSSYFFDEEHEEPQASWSQTATAAVPILSTMTSQTAANPEYVDKVEDFMRDVTCLSVLIGSLCIVPSVCCLRVTVQNKLSHEEHESLWRTGLISCCAWPCAITQISKEIDYNT